MTKYEVTITHLSVDVYEVDAKDEKEAEDLGLVQFGYSNPTKWEDVRTVTRVRALN